MFPPPPARPVASTSRLPDPPIVTLVTNLRPPRKRRRLARSSIIFVLSLCVPYVPYVVSASPIPERVEASNLRRYRHLAISQPTSPFSHLMQALQAASSTAAKHIFGREPSTSTVHPIIALATHGGAESYTIPDEYVKLVQKFDGGFIVLSFAIAFVGSLCTLELLLRRTTNSGWRNQVLLASAGITFGAVSTFAMHFIFNNSLSLHHPLHRNHNYPAIYLSYDPGYTVLSLVASCSAMTIAFFVMGTSLHDWYCMPGRRRRRERGISYPSSSRNGGDEYGNWKSAHKKVMRRRTVDMGTLMQQAGAVAKWSLMEPGEAKKKHGWKSALRKGEGEVGDMAEVGDPHCNNEDVQIKHDKKLEDLEFRLGRSAVNLELERRQGNSQISEVNTDLNGSSVRLIPSNSSLPQSPLPLFHSPQNHRRSLHEPMHSPLSSADVSAPGYDIHIGIDNEPNSPSAVLQPKSQSAPKSAHAPVLWQPGLPPQFSEASISGLPDLSHRRASLPSTVLRPLRHEASAGAYRAAPTLTRLQSLPEAGQEQHATARVESEDGNSARALNSPTVAVNARLETLVESRDASPPDKRVRVVNKRTLSKLEKFLGFDVVTSSEVIKICITGTLAGFGVAAMHYIGQFSITGMPYIAYKAPYVVGSVVIASGAVVVALYIMFIMLRPKLKHTWLSKLMVAAILAIAVCSMHFCGMMGTIYAWPEGEGITRHEMLRGTNRVITAIVATLAFLTCIACGIFFLLHSIRLRKERARRRRVVVACVLLDTHDRVLVSATDGMLPMCDIASLTGSGEETSSKRSIKSGFGSLSSDSTLLGMDLSTGHDAFIAALRMSWSWKNSDIALPNMTAASNSGGQSGLQPIGAASITERGSTTTLDSLAMSSRQMRISVTKFLDRFSISAGQLASRLIGQPNGISRLGVLYDQILTIGWVKLNKSNDTVSKGQLIFLVRRVTSSVERSDLLSRHYIFADREAVASTLHKTLSVPLDHTMPLLEDIRHFCDSTKAMSLKAATLYAGVAVVQATPFDGLRLLLEQDNRSQLPMREICPLAKTANDVDELSGTLEELGEAITWLDGMSLLSVITRNMTVHTDQLGGPLVSRLLHALERAIVPLLDDILNVEDMAHILPRLFLHPVLVPLTPGGLTKGSQVTDYIPPYVVVFYANYDAAENTFTDKWLPFNLFRVQNACVMAQQIQAASVSAAEQPLATSDFLQPEEVIYQRRPSKVQFEFPPEQIHGEKEATTLPSNNTDLAPTTIFNGFSFPPRRDESPASGIAHSASKKSSVPARSNIARSRYNSVGAEGGNHPHPLDATNAKEAPTRLAVEVLPGVVSWDPDWLLVLLRTKLRADA